MLALRILRNETHAYIDVIFKDLGGSLRDKSVVGENDGRRKLLENGFWGRSAMIGCCGVKGPGGPVVRPTTYVYPGYIHMQVPPGLFSR